MSNKVVTPMAGTMWKILVKIGDNVSVGDTIAILESMKMEIPIETEVGGVIQEINTEEGAVLDEGATIVTVG